jgi:hypothetical protein
LGTHGKNSSKRFVWELHRDAGLSQEWPGENHEGRLRVLPAQMLTAGKASAIMAGNNLRRRPSKVAKGFLTCA